MSSNTQVLDGEAWANGIQPFTRTLGSLLGNGNTNNNAEDDSNTPLPNLSPSNNNRNTSQHFLPSVKAPRRQLIWSLLVPFLCIVSFLSGACCTETDHLQIVVYVKIFCFLHYPINRRLHEVVLEQLRYPEKFPLVLRDHADVYSTLVNTTQEVSGFIANASQICNLTPSEYDNITFYYNIHVAREQMSLAASQINRLAGIYDSVREEYYVLNITTAEAFRKVQLSISEAWWIANRPLDLKWTTGFRVSEERAKRSKEARSRVTAWERETRRLDRIITIIQKADEILQNLPDSLDQWNPEIKDHSHNPSSSMRW